MTVLFFSGLVVLTTAACSGADPTPQKTGGEQQAPDPLGWPPSDNHSDQDDGSFWPPWVNPCPGPACDPYRSDPKWLIDPPPDSVMHPGVENVRPNLGIAPQAISGAGNSGR